jgi:hypothetical protein
MLNKEFFLWLKRLASYEPFQECIALSDKPLSESYDLELALRFIIFSLIEVDELNNIGDVGVFISDKMSGIASQKDFDGKLWNALFQDTFCMLADELGDSSFKRYNNDKSRFMGGFLLSQFEVVACGIAYNLYHKKSISEVSQKVANIWSNKQYTEWSGSGITATRRLPRLIPFGRETFSNGN